MPRPSGPSSLYDIAPDPGSTGGLYVAASALATTDAGTTWTMLGAGPPQIAGVALAVSPFDVGRSTPPAGSPNSASSPDAGRTWLSPPNENFARLSTNNLAVTTTTPEVVYAGTNDESPHRITEGGRDGSEGSPIRQVS